MSMNTRCALECWIEGQWVPKALRYTRMSVRQRQALNRGEVIELEGRKVRRVDFAERAALSRILQFPWRG